MTREQLQKGLTFVVVDLSLSLSVFICIQVVSIKDTQKTAQELLNLLPQYQA